MAGMGFNFDNISASSSIGDKIDLSGGRQQNSFLNQFKFGDVIVSGDGGQNIAQDRSSRDSTTLSAFWKEDTEWGANESEANAGPKGPLNKMPIKKSPGDQASADDSGLMTYLIVGVVLVGAVFIIKKKKAKS
ncbi:hypothetical protein R6242_10780 [Iodobacter sp. CM08]|uniref:hypothetical protein n=1 Tax=Iodobacter sp. CM08 TaxID=3085902 RepID=UPI002982A461|nr:hypothetical protein [Iodobacter sp. CM08]MDW5417049.1 hypothetical protein [Iodobacter sp. CM08]